MKIDGNHVLLDPSDELDLSKYSWHEARRSGYTYFFRYLKISIDGVNKWQPIFMHRWLCSASKGDVIDHINGNTLDNRRSNLRVTNRLGNSRNTKLTSTNKSGIRGITSRVYRKTYFEVVIRNKYKTIRIGPFDNIMVAEYHLMKACNEYHGEFSRYAKYKN